ncbi:MAG: hypothetical protein COA52_05370 [Hyphomicrobiales bacterium]|nr:hypothetical protein [Hyphomicrobiales bacterium]PCJ94293.1 MAG: hypothetical protein COA52_05370 [Hyphomicrobiales bacterium]
MAWAINIKSENQSAKRVCKLWEQVGKLEETPNMLSHNYPPYITFAIYDEIDFPLIKDVTQQVFQNRKSITILFDCVKYFDLQNLVLWASPSEVSSQLEIHQELHSKINTALCREYYRPQKVGAAQARLA